MVDAPLLTRFEGDLGRLVAGRPLIGLAVSGGPDSLALLLLAAAARPGSIRAATVDHGLRPESAAEAAMVAELCGRLGVPHTVLRVAVARGASLQAQAREARYAALARWAREGGLPVLLTAHHADDQAETLLMRLARGSGLSGLAGVRATRKLGHELAVVRPLLGWRKAELRELVRAAGISPIDDPANRDPRHDRTRVRDFLAQEPWLDPLRLAAAASCLGEAEEALAFAADRVFAERQRTDGEALCLDVADLPRELQRRLLLRAFETLGAEIPRGPDLDRALGLLREGRACTLAGMKLEGGGSWRIGPAPPRRQFAPSAAP